MIRSLFARTLVVGALGAALALAWPAADSSAVGAGDAIGTYVLKLKGDGFDRNADDGRIDERKIRGAAMLTISAAAGGGDPRELTVRVDLAGDLRGSVLDRATPTPALEGRGILVGDSLTAIGAGQTNFVNAVTLRFTKKGRRVEGWWLASFPGSDPQAGFVAGAGLAFRGRQIKRPR